MTPELTNSPQAFDAALTRALDHAPAPAIPVDFAARVRAALPPQRAARPAISAARIAAIAAVCVLTIAVFVFAPHATPSFASVNFYIELLLLAELAGITYWLSARHSFGTHSG